MSWFVEALTLSRRNQIILVDDPNFVLDFNLPSLDFNENGDLVIPGLDFDFSQRMHSQLSPFDNSNSSNSPANAPFINLDIRHSSSQGSVNLALPFDKGNANDDSTFPMIFGDEEDLPLADFPFRVDEDGNLIEEPELPPHPSQADGAGDAAQQGPSGIYFPDEDGLIIPGDEEQMVFDDEEEGQLPVVDPVQQNVQQIDDVPFPSEEPLSSEAAEQVLQPRHKQRKTKTKGIAPDAATHISRSEFKGWTDNYLARTVEANNAPQQVTPTQAKRNAYSALFGKGLGDVGLLNGIPGLNHELAEVFAGDNLREMVMADMLADIQEKGEEDAGEGARGDQRRRSASVAFGSDEEEEAGGRRVRPRIDEDGQERSDEEQEQGRSQEEAQVVDDGMMLFGKDEDLLPEAGREHPGSALSDHRRSSNAPWNRPSSVIPSSARSGKHIEIGRNAVEQSPLVGRGSILQSEVKFSDGPGMPGSDGFADFQHDGAGHDLSSFGDFGPAAAAGVEANTSQFVREALDREGRNFLGFVEHVAGDRGEEDDRNESLRWVDFDGLFEAQDQTRAVMAQGFLHVLTLATKNQIRVRQAGVQDKVPFGEIHVGVTAVDHKELDEDEQDVNDEMEVDLDDVDSDGQEFQDAEE